MAEFPEMVLEGPGTYALPGGGALLVEVTGIPAAWQGVSARVAYFDADAAPFPWLVRTFKAGDRFMPLGLTGHKKVKDFFIDEKVPLAARRRVPLLFSVERLIWVGGFLISAEARLTERTGLVMRAEILDFAPQIDL